MTICFVVVVWTFIYCLSHSFVRAVGGEPCQRQGCKKTSAPVLSIYGRCIWSSSYSDNNQVLLFNYNSFFANKIRSDDVYHDRLINRHGKLTNLIKKYQYTLFLSLVILSDSYKLSFRECCFEYQGSSNKNYLLWQVLCFYWSTLCYRIVSDSHQQRASWRANIIKPQWFIWL